MEYGVLAITSKIIRFIIGPPIPSIVYYLSRFFFFFVCNKNKIFENINNINGYKYQFHHEIPPLISACNTVMLKIVNGVVEIWYFNNN